MDNPYALTPGKLLTPQALFTQYLRWCKFAKDNKSSSVLPGCNELISSNLCCEHHYQYQAEHDQFFNYFFYLHMFPSPDNGFSINSMIKMMVDFNLYGELGLLQSYHGAFADNFFKKAKDSNIKIV